MPRAAPVTTATLPASGRSQSSGPSGAAAAHPDHLAGDVGRPAREQEAQRRLELGPLGGVHELCGRARAHLLAGRAHEPLERALRHAVAGADHDEPPARRQVTDRRHGRSRRAARRSAVRSTPVASKISAAHRSPPSRTSIPIRASTLAHGAAAAEPHRPLEQPGPAPQRRRLRQPEPAGHEAARRRAGELLVAIGHCVTPYPVRLSDERERLAMMTEKIAILGGNRIPFARSNGPYADASNQDMLTAALDGLVARFGLQGERAGEVVAGAVLKHSRDFNLTRETVLGSALDQLDARLRPPDGVRHRPAGGARGGGQDRARADRVGHRGRRRHHQRRPDRDQRGPAARAARGQPHEDRAGPAEAARPPSARARSCPRSRATPSRAPACRWASTRPSPRSAGASRARRRTS